MSDARMEQDRALEVLDDLAGLFGEAFPRANDHAAMLDAVDRFRRAHGRLPRYIPSWVYFTLRRGRPRGGPRGPRGPRR